MDLVALPCPAELVAPFLDRLPSTRYDALVLDKQADALVPLLLTREVRAVETVPEAYYGQATRAETRDTLRRLARRGYERAYFPVNNFGGNVALLLRALAPDVVALSATAEPPLAQPLPPASAFLPEPPSGPADRPAPAPAALRALEAEIVRRLRAPDPRQDRLDGAGRAGERPTGGLAAGFPYDAEVLSRYVAAAARVRGRVVELGCGLGYGAWLLAQLAPDVTVTAFDYDAEAVALARARFGDEPRLTFAEGRAEQVPLPDGAADAVVCFEILEHLPEPAALVREARRLLAPGGTFVGSTPDHRLYPYRVNDGRPGTPAELRAQGLWPWHVAALDEGAVRALLAAAGFADVRCGYPTWTTGLAALAQVRAAADVDEALTAIAALTWTAADFALRAERVPVFSGFSFLFAARREPGGPRTAECRERAERGHPDVGGGGAR
jgi:SAM-dependent methyltransferase